MIEYAKTSRGDILRIVGAGAPGFAQQGDLVRVLEVHANAVKVEDRYGSSADFMYNCGAARLEPTEWRDDFPCGEQPSPAHPAAELPRYKSHKEVRALKIAAIETKEDGSAVIAPADRRYAAFTTEQGWSARFKGTDEDPGYYVLYEGGYASWSPSKAFEEGYTRI